MFPRHLQELLLLLFCPIARPLLYARFVVTIKVHVRVLFEHHLCNSLCIEIQEIVRWIGIVSRQWIYLGIQSSRTRSLFASAKRIFI